MEMGTGKVMASAGVVGGFTMVSRVLGLIRDMLMAGVFGMSLHMSAFVVAFTIPNLFRRLFGEGALSAAFMPVFIETRAREGDASAWGLARNVLSLVAVFLTAVVVIGIVGITLVLWLGEGGEKTELTLSLSRVMLPYMVFICLAALCMALLNAYHHFATPAAAPALLNVVWIAAVVLVVPCLDSMNARIHAVAWAVLLAGLLQAGIQIPRMMQYGYRPGLSLRVGDEKVRRILHLMGPASIGMAVTQINVLLDRLMAVWIGVWAPAALFFAERLIYLPQGLFATALSTVLLPVFSGQAARADHTRLRETVRYSLCNLLYVMIPASAGLLVLAVPIVQMIFERNAFTEASTAMTALALQCYAPGLLVFSLSKVFVPAFYAMQDTRTPLRTGLVAVCVKLGCSVVLIMTLPTHLKHGGLAAATVIGEGVNGILLGYMLHRRVGSPGWGTILKTAARCLGASVIMAWASWRSHHLLAGWMQEPWGEDHVFSSVAPVLGAIGVGIAVYAVATWLLRAPEIRAVSGALKRRWRRGTSA